MIVLDASVVIEWLIQSPVGLQVQSRIHSRLETLHAPHLLDVEVAQVLGRLAREGMLSDRRASEAVQDLRDLRITRYPHSLLLSQIWNLRHNFSAYDAAYVALAEQLNASLITRDRKLAAASGHAAKIELM